VPTYQYRCTDCGEPLEVVQSFTDNALTVCPACGGALRKVFSSVGVVFKGSGFYRTDSRAAAESKAAAAKTETKTDAKTETKTDANGSRSDGKPDKPADKPAAGAVTKTDSSTSKSSAA
jgi:putative FmdB family regulatory protein